MAPRLPAGFISIAEAQSKRDDKEYDIIGVCTDYLPPAQSGGSDLTMKVTLWDVTCLDVSGLGQDGMVFRFFAKDMWQLPRVEETGDVLILRNIRTRNHKNGSQWFGLSTFGTKWNAIPAAALLDGDEANLADVQERAACDGRSPTDAKQGPAPTIQVLKYAQELLQIKDPTTLHGPPKSTALDQATIIKANGGQPPAMAQKLRLLKDLIDPREHGNYQFVDLVGEVRRVFHGGNPVEVQVTDFTENSLLFNYTYQGQEGYVSSTNYWPGPWGQMTITVCAWDEHADHIRQMAFKQEIQVGMYVRMKNVQIKLDRNGGMMQGHIRGVPGSSRSNIEFLRPREAESDKDLKDLLRRRRDYNIAIKAKKIGFQQDGLSTLKRKDRDEAEVPIEPHKKSKGKNKKKKEQQRKAGKTNGKPDRDNGPTATNSKSLSNQHVRCEAIEIPLTAITSILSTEQLQRTTSAGNAYELPFQNCKYKSKVQVVDFFPDKLEDFASPYRTSDYEILSDYESDDDSAVSLDFARNNPYEVRWEWHFFLMVQDPQPTKAQKALQNIPDQPTMLLQVAGQDGDYLLNTEACDLRNSPQAFAMLKEKLFVLWGDLEEKKIEHSKTGQELQDGGVVISSKPFECLIKEYGVNARTKEGLILDDEWERMFGLFKTNIG
ncbi:hypothetical protein LTR70_006741 [Exophiala xenobiotica]|uniref:Protection of telomeres protein 1 n=1 Tax=Lithohypha guttulata TaxID=1690604 RepID=A0ABR0KA94_9EURO|nr:hypothetical protein LTR24_005007 [Lithohypha guttulata]KAK5315402.1 hypothetical protein LTR70_006741 [Exophiala xenobiotica]